MAEQMEQYSNLVQEILDHGEEREDRTGVGTLAVFGKTMTFKMGHGAGWTLPLLTLKKTNFDAIAHELLWFLSGDTNIKYLQENNVHIWDEWADDDGELGPVYGSQWRHWRYPVHEHGDEISYDEVDQIDKLVRGLKESPHSRRHLVSAWNVAELSDMALSPCHYAFQCYVSSDGALSMMVHQRSADMLLGVPFNIASYSLLLHLLSHCCGYRPDKLVYTLGDAHIYLNHVHGALRMLQRQHRDEPRFHISAATKDIFEITKSDFWISNYNPHPYIPLKVAV